MTKKSVTALWVIVALLASGVASLSMKKTDTGKSNTKRSRGQTLFEAFPAAEAASIEIKDAENSVHLTKTEKGWVVNERNNYPANTATINALLRTIAEVKVNEGIEAGSSYAKRFGIDGTSQVKEEHGVQLIFSNNKAEKIATVLLGKDASGGGRFIQNAADTSGIYVTQESFPTANADAKIWLEDDFIKVEKIKSIAVSAEGKANEIVWKLTRPNENAEFTLEGAKDNENVDSNNVSALKNIFSYARFQDVSPPENLEVLKQSKLARTATIETSDGFTYEISFAKKPVAQDEKEKPTDTENPQDELYDMSVKVSANFPKERDKVLDEKPEDKKKNDDAFATNLKTLNEKLALEKSIEGHAYEVSKFTVEPLMKNRADLLGKSNVPTAPPAALRPAPPISAPTSATTPPVSLEDAKEE